MTAYSKMGLAFGPYMVYSKHAHGGYLSERETDEALPSLWGGSNNTYYMPMTIYGATNLDKVFFCKLPFLFEYTDPVAQIGYYRTVYPVFTADQVLLERAEAKTMLGRYDDAAQDLMAFWNNPINTFNEEQKKSYFDTGYMKLMTPDVITGYYAKENKQNVNILADWSFTSRNVSPTFNVPAEAVPYMNCINDFRRWETVLMGMRFFDLKRTGKFLERIKKMNPDVADVIQEYHQLRPIPQSEIDALTNKSEFQQNKGY
jgi:hypothetical protein